MITIKSYMAEEKGNFMNDENLLFDKMLAGLPGLNSKIQSLPALVNEAFFGSYNLYKVMLEKTDELFRNIQAKVKQNHQNAPEFSKSLSKKKLISDKITFALQYQDIIEQKLQHILLIQKDTYEQISKEIHTNEVETQELVAQKACIILEITSAQLSDIIPEYGQAFKQISECCSLIEEEITKIRLILSKPSYNNFLHERQLSDVAFEKIKTFNKENHTASSSFKEASQEIIDFCKSIPKIEKQHFKELPAIKEIEKLYTMESERRIFNEVLFGTISKKVESPINDIEIF